MIRPALIISLFAFLSSLPLLAQPSPVGPSPSRSPAVGAPDDLQPPTPPPIPPPPIETAPIAPPREESIRPNIDPTAASDAFINKRYAEAAALFAQAHQQKVELTPTQRDQWGYCRLYAVAERLNRGGDNGAALVDLGREVDDALRLGSDKLMPFGKKLLEEIRRRNPDASKPAAPGWQSIETASFRVMYQGPKELADEVAHTAEAARRAMYERWAGPPSGNWSPKCDVYLHSTSADYSKATGKPVEQLGHSTVDIKGGRPVRRQIDLRFDDETLLDSTLPSEVTQVVLADLFADEPLPRWAVVGMAALAESPEGVARYQRAVPGLLKDRKLFAVGPFMEKPGFPDAKSITAFYAESVSLVSFLVELRGPKAFTAFLREAPRRGFAKAITNHYGFKDAAELQDRWVRHSLGGE